MWGPLSPKAIGPEHAWAKRRLKQLEAGAAETFPGELDACRRLVEACEEKK